MSEEPLEIELKYRLANWRDIHRLVEKMNAPEAHYTQTNNYLDDARRALRAKKIMLRAREITFPVGMAKGLGKPPVTITAKRKKSIDNGVFVNEERQQVMHIDDWRDIEYGKAQIDMKGPVFAWLLEQVPDLGKLRILGQTENIRWQIYSDIFMLELDKTVFPDGTIEAEIEVETSMPEEARKHILELCGKHFIEVKPATQGKYARFLEKAEGVSDYAD
ncbi:MAG: CYTH domain-containing protein [Deltaproteobacteria bacterium]|nr:CYTH domain-containing protein [Deltaproteobacteria bacterium]